MARELAPTRSRAHQRHRERGEPLELRGLVGEVVLITPTTALVLAFSVTGIGDRTYNALVALEWPWFVPFLADAVLAFALPAAKGPGALAVGKRTGKLELVVFRPLLAVAGLRLPVELLLLAECMVVRVGWARTGL